MLSEKDKRRAYHLMRTYGITLKQYEQLSKGQGHSCGVCKRHRDEFKTNLAVDHDHKTGEIFGLLCTHCNRRVIGRDRKPEIFYNASKFLEVGTGLFVPKKKPKKRKRKRNANTKLQP